ncbi:MAG TPA: hypothetical protein VIL57_04145 [Bacteroidia bacterium]
MKSKLFAIAFMLVPVLTFAQEPASTAARPKKDHAEMQKKMTEMRVNYVRENLGLTDAQNEKFIPLYKEKLEKVAALRKEQRSVAKDFKTNFESKSDVEIDASMKAKFDAQLKVLNLEKEYYEKFKSVIPVKKVAKLEQVEREFHMSVLRKSKGGDHKGARPQGPAKDAKTAPVPPVPPVVFEF